MATLQPQTAVRRPDAGNPWRNWVLAARPMTLPAAVVPVMVGTAAAYPVAGVRWPVFWAALVSALCIQIGTNFANDLYDFARGADTAERLGPTRVIQAGLLSPAQVGKGMWAMFAAAFASGLYLVTVGGWPILVIGLAAIACGILYTAGPWALAYNGLGDLFAFLFFGLIAVNATFYLHTGSLGAVALWASLPVAFLVTAILVVNNLRDVETDRKAGKRTLAVRLGAPLTRLEYALLVAGALVVPIVLWQLYDIRGAWLPLLTLPLAVRLTRGVYRARGAELNRVLKGTGMFHLLHGLLASAGLIA